MTDEQRFRRLLERSASRRQFLVAGGGVASLVLLGTLPAKRADAAVRTATYPFTLGIASGDPSSSGVVLWTRLAPDPLNGGGMPEERVPVRWEIAHDEAFGRVVKNGDTLAIPELAHSVHVEVDGLEPDRVYFYRFVYAGEASPVGRTRTAPAPGVTPDRLTFAFASCQNYQQGLYTAYRHMAAEDLQLLVHLGDYIYEGGVASNAVRPHNSPEITTLQDYRNRYALYKSDADLQAAHAAFPFVVTWDDHEFATDYADEHSEQGTAVEPFLRRRAAAYQAYYEHMPLRRSEMPKGPDLVLYRRLTYGTLAEFNVIDTRQYRAPQPCGNTTVANCPAARGPRADILGSAQQAWLLEGLGHSRARWNILANQVPFSPTLRRSSEGMGYAMDKWDGYSYSRDRVLEVLRERRVSNPVVLTGDVHVSWVAGSLDAPDAPPIGAEFVGTSISSGGNGNPMTSEGELILQHNPHIRYYNAQRGYVRATLTADRWTSDYRIVPTVTEPGAPIRTDASFVVENGRAGVQRV
ncbi:MAG TPA: alkaline phosphatase D family protein [Longimicrobiaceae bacterium]